MSSKPVIEHHYIRKIAFGIVVIMIIISVIDMYGVYKHKQEVETAEYSIEIINDTNKDICEFTVTPNKDEKLSQVEPIKGGIETGESHIVAVTKHGLYDIQAVPCNESAYINITDVEVKKTRITVRLNGI